MPRLTSSPPPLVGHVSMPGDKSISHRALMIAALARGRSRIVGCNSGTDVAATRAALVALGAEVSDTTTGVVEVEGCAGAGGLHEPPDVIDVGNSGTSLRCLAGVAAGLPGSVVLTGDASVRARPMLRVVVPLRAMGASIDGRRYGDRAPLAIRGGDLQAIDHVGDVASAQVKTAVLLAALSARGTTSVTEPRLSRDHSERMLGAAGVALRRTGTKVSVDGPAVPEARDWIVPGDISAALFLIVGALIVPGSDLVIENVGLNPTRAAALDVLRAMGATIETEITDERDGEPRGRVRVRHARLSATEVRDELGPALIDEVPALAIAASVAEGTTLFDGVEELRVKESDRIAAMVDGLHALGVAAESTPGGFTVTGGSLGEGRIDPLGDHRIAMAFAIAGLAATGRVTVGGWSCVDTSFPGFLDTLAEAREPR